MRPCTGPPGCCPGSGRAESISHPGGCWPGICPCYIPPLCLSALIWVTLMVQPGEKSQPWARLVAAPSQRLSPATLWLLAPSQACLAPSSSSIPAHHQACPGGICRSSCALVCDQALPASREVLKPCAPSSVVLLKTQQLKTASLSCRICRVKSML